MKTFLTIWVGQFISLIGSGLTSFALSIWVLKHTQSVTQFTLTVVFGGLPGILLGPFAGALVDRWDRRWVLFWCNIGPALEVALFSYLVSHNQLQVWHIYLGVIFTSILASFQWPAYIAAITMLVQPKDYGRVNGLIEMAQAVNGIAAPALAGLLVFTIGVPRILLIDLATFLVAAGVLLVVRIPRPEASEEGKKAKGSLWKEAGFGMRFIRERPGLFRLLLFFAGFNLVAAMGGVVVQPLVLAFSNEKGVGTIMSISAIGMFLGGLVMTATGGTKRRIYGLLGGWAVISLCMFLVGLKPSLVLVGIGALIWYMAIPIINASSQAIWQSKTPRDVQGRVFAVRRMIAQFTVPIGDFLAGPLCDKIFNPAMVAGGAFAGSAGRIMGVGPGRGIGLLLVTLSIVPAFVALMGFLDPRVRNLESELPDAVRKTEPEPEPAPEPEATAEEVPAQA